MHERRHEQHAFGQLGSGYVLYQLSRHQSAHAVADQDEGWLQMWLSKFVSLGQQLLDVRPFVL